MSGKNTRTDSFTEERYSKSHQTALARIMTVMEVAETDPLIKFYIKN